jgi:hypothetical protein
VDQFGALLGLAGIDIIGAHTLVIRRRRVRRDQQQISKAAVISGHGPTRTSTNHHVDDTSVVNTSSRP